MSEPTPNTSVQNYSYLNKGEGEQLNYPPANYPPVNYPPSSYPPSSYPPSSYPPSSYFSPSDDLFKNLSSTIIKNNGLKFENTKLKTDNESFYKENKKLKRENDQMYRDSKDLKHDNSALYEDNKHLKYQIDQMREDINYLKLKLKTGVTDTSNKKRKFENAVDTTPTIKAAPIVNSGTNSSVNNNNIRDFIKTNIFRRKGDMVKCRHFDTVCHKNNKCTFLHSEEEIQLNNEVFYLSK
jgi:regulator of replication initiation timing